MCWLSFVWSKLLTYSLYVLGLLLINCVSSLLCVMFVCLTMWLPDIVGLETLCVFCLYEYVVWVWLGFLPQWLWPFSSVCCVHSISNRTATLKKTAPRTVGLHSISSASVYVFVLCRYTYVLHYVLLFVTFLFLSFFFVACWPARRGWPGAWRADSAQCSV